MSQIQACITQAFLLGLKMITYGSICSGIEAASVAWEPLGLKPLWFSEIEPFPSAVLNHHWPHTPNLGDMRSLADGIMQGEIHAPDILVGGTPCQAFSVAGRHESLDDERGNLTLELVRILNAIDTIRQRNGKPPAILVWENVPGIFSTKDNAFGCFLGSLAGESVPLEPAGKKWTNAGCVSGPTRKIAWRVLDAQFFGVPQRRRRIFLVAGAGKTICPSKILFEQQGCGWNFEARSSEENQVARTITTRPGLRGNATCDTFIVEKSAQNISVVNGNIINRSLTSGGNGKGFINDGSVYTLTTNTIHVVQVGVSVRRLTPLECERLQGFPDNHTQVPYRNKAASDCPDTARYKAIGNSMAVPVMRWIGKRLKQELECAS